MRLESGEELLTIKDIASWISFDRSEEGIARTLRQVRHWTQCDLLRTVSEKNTGKGVPRFYRLEPDLYIAAILIELSRYGVTADVMKPVSDELYDEWYEQGGFYLHAFLTDVNAFLQASWTADPKSGRLTDAHVHLFVAAEIESEPTFDPAPSSSVLINMTLVMTRVYDNKSADQGIGHRD
jgi:hypothetical protein